MNILNYEINKLNNVYYKGEKYIVILWGGILKMIFCILCIVYYDVKVVRIFV